jgi:hypothetical protein
MQMLLLVETGPVVTGTFNPNRNTANATYTPAAGEIGTTITLTWNAPDPDGAGPCTAATDAMTITVNAPVLLMQELIKLFAVQLLYH